MMLMFTDQSGTVWDVFEVHPSQGRTVSRVPEDFREGWLCFQSANERRRLAPIPPGWREWDVDVLTAALDATRGIPRRTPHRSFDAIPRLPRTSGETALT